MGDAPAVNFRKIRAAESVRQRSPERRGMMRGCAAAVGHVTAAYAFGEFSRLRGRPRLQSPAPGAREAQGTPAWQSPQA
jgi:hypothetical protein